MIGAKGLAKELVVGAAIGVAALVGAPTAAAEGFTSPSGNIGCILSDTSLRCDVGDRDWSPPPRPADCPDFSDYGQGIMIHPTGLPVSSVQATPPWAAVRCWPTGNTRPAAG